MINRKLFILIFLACGLKGFSQLPNQAVSLPSPTSSSLGQFGETPVSLHSGIPQINIPLYEINEGPIKIPIQLRYHASGFRPDVHPGPVGMGFSLSSGGAITRVVKGTPDDASWQQIYRSNGAYVVTQTRYVGHLYNDILTDPIWNTSARIEYLAKRGMQYGPDTYDYYCESEPDEFNFNFLGYSGTFIFDEYGQPKVLTDPSIKIEFKVQQVNYENFYDPSGYYFTYKMQPMSAIIASGTELTNELKIVGFRLTTADGTRYDFGTYDFSWNFGSSTWPFDTSVNFFQQAFCNESWDSWYLRKVTATTGHAVTFEYGYPKGESFPPPIGSFARTFAIQKSSGTAKGIFSIFGPVRSSSYNVDEYYDGRLIYPAYVSKIITSNEEIKFDYSTTNELRYNQTAISNSLQTQINQSWSPYVTVTESPYEQVIDPTGFFDTDYMLRWKQLDKITVVDKSSQKERKSWQFNFSNSYNQRLTLNSMTEKGENGAGQPSTYSFRYNTSKALPPYLVYQTDHWGFYNGKPASVGDLSDLALGTTFSSYKTVDTTFVLAGTLDKITYPTGGSTEFTYEANRYTGKVKRDSISGNFSSVTTPVTYAGGLRIKSIKNIYGNGSPDVVKTYQYFDGKLSGDVKYFWKNYKGKLVNGNTYYSDRFVSQTMLPVSTNSIGNHIGYSKVRERVTGTLTNSSGYTDYYYSNYDILDDNFVATVDTEKARFAPFSSRSADRGLLLKRETFNESAVPVSKTEYTYQPYDSNNFYRATSTKQFKVLEGDAIEGTSYKIYNYPKNPIQIKTTTYEPSDLAVAISETVDNTYEPKYNFIKDKTITNSKALPVKISYSYPHNMVLNAADPTGIYSSMEGAHVIAPVIEQTQKNNNVQTDFTKINYGLLINGYAPFSVQTKGRSTEPLETRTKYLSYDSVGNPLATQKENAGIVTSYIWGYKKRLPIAECINTTPNEFCHENFEESSTFDANVSQDNTRSHTGKYSGKITNAGPGEKVSHGTKTVNLSMSASKKFIYSGWVYSDGPSVQLWLFMKRFGEPGTLLISTMQKQASLDSGYSFKRNLMFLLTWTICS